MRDLAGYSHFAAKKNFEKNAPSRDTVGKKTPIINELDFRWRALHTVRKLFSEATECIWGVLH